jgi:ferritin-like metal-binding protein YciE
MEKALVQVLQHRIKDAADYPELRRMDEQHLEETRHHVELVAGCIERLGEKPSTVKSVIGTLFGTLQAPMTGLAKDEIVKNCLIDYAAEQFEVVSYQALIEAARQAGDSETAVVCQQIMLEDQMMADRIIRSLPGVVADHVATPDTELAVAGE